VPKAPGNTRAVPTPAGQETRAGKEVNQVESNQNQEITAAEIQEIIELDERLDMAFDPLGLIVELRTPNDNCNNNNCCNG
jgi:hypothetical protein